MTLTMHYGTAKELLSMAIDIAAMSDLSTEEQRHSRKRMQQELGGCGVHSDASELHNQTPGSASGEEALPAECNDEENGRAHNEKPRTDGAVDNGEEDGEQEEEEESENEEDAEEADRRTESYVDHDTVGHGDNEVEYHDTAISVIRTNMPQEAMIEASKKALFRRYSKMTPSAIEEHEKSFHDEPGCEGNDGLFNMIECPEPNSRSCQNSVCLELLRWRDARIADLQAALDHMAEAMAIQQRDMASQRVFLSRQAEQLTNLSIKLHHEKVALHVEKERFHRSTLTTGPLSLKHKSDKPKSPVKKILSVATGRRATVHDADRIVAKPLSDAGNVAESSSSRSGSSSQLRQNPLCIDTPRAPLAERSSSLSSLELRTASTKTIITITPPKHDGARTTSPFLDAPLVEVVLTDPHSPTQTPVTQTTEPIHSPSFKLQDIDQLKRSDRGDSAACPTPDQKKLSLGDRFRSIRWGRI